MAAALLLNGSGPLDRDGDHPKLALGVSRLLAEALADAGVVTLRYDKRGAGASDGDFLSTGFHDNIEDATAAARFLSDHDAAAGLPLVVVGHSEGAVLAAALGARERLDGLALLSCSARDGRATLTWQAEMLQGDLPLPVRVLLRLLRTDLVRQNRRRIDKISATTADVGRSGGVRLNLRWFREYVAFDPREALAEVRAPVLALTGAKDLQVPPEDVAAIGAHVQGPFTGRVVDDVNHILRTEPGPPSLRRYRKQAALPLDERVVAALLGWISETIAPAT